MKEHKYLSQIIWTGNNGSGTDHYKNYERAHKIAIENKPLIYASSDPDFRGDPNRHHPEDLLVSSVSSCHMLWYLHFCSLNNVVVVAYTDHAEGVMLEERDGRGYFKAIILNPIVIVTHQHMLNMAMDLHKKASEYCFIANSLNFPITHHPIIQLQ